VELCNPESIRELIAGYVNPTLGERRRDARNAARPAKKDRTVRCKCGHCRQCLDNARWERIFVEKFADPTYYDRRAVRIGSPLTSI
jgi:hypothetical protein